MFQAQANGTLRWFCQYQPEWDKFEIHLRQKREDVIRFGRVEEYVQVEPGEDVAPLIRLKQEEAQQLMNALWDAGLRPAGAAGSAGQLSAVETHLADMRKIVFETFLPMMPNSFLLTMEKPDGES